MHGRIAGRTHSQWVLATGAFADFVAFLAMMGKRSKLLTQGMPLNIAHNAIGLFAKTVCTPGTKVRLLAM